MRRNHKQGMRLSTINQIIEYLYSPSVPISVENINAACIILKMAYITEMRGIEAGIKYYEGTHNTREFEEYLTQVFYNGK